MVASEKLCLSPYLDRLNYFYGQMLGVRDFQTEQNYFREKIKLHNRCLHGVGVVCGLEVKFKEWHTHGENSCWPIVSIDCGLALDAEGNELIVREPLCVDLYRCLSKEDQERIAKETSDKEITVYLSVRFRATPMEPIRPVALEGCGDHRAYQFGRLRDSVCCSASRDMPADDYVCDPCCEPATASGAHDEHCCHPEGPPILLASIKFTRNGESRPQIDNTVRPLLGHHGTKVSGVNWVHGGLYPGNLADLLLRHGLRIRLSRPIRPEAIQPGIMDVLLYMGGGNVSGDVKHLGGAVKVEPDKNGRPTRLVFEFDPKQRERPDPGDRIHVILRSAFILDECCRPLDGLHIGGWAPFDDDDSPIKHPDSPIHIPDDCKKRIGTFAPWASGTGSPGGNFESWFFVSESSEQGTYK